MLAKNRLHGTLAALAVGLLASGCGSGPGSTTAKSPAQSPSSVATTASSSPDPVASSTAEATISSSTDTTSGTYLATLLAAPTTLGKGLVVDTKVNLDSGEDHPASTIADVTQATCSKTLHSDWMLDAGSGDAFAFRMYKNSGKQEVTERFDHFGSPDDAQSYMKNIRQLAPVCTGRTTDPLTQSKVTFKGKAVSGLGDEAYAITGTTPDWQSGQTMEAVRVGDVVVTTFALDGVADDNGASLAVKVLTNAVTKLKAAS